MNYAFFTGLIGSLILVCGAAWPESKKNIHPIKSIKNWLFAIGSIAMLLYSIFIYMNGDTVFFVILEIMVVIASVLMMLNTKDKIDIPVIGTSCLALIIWSISIFEPYNTILLILGLTGIALGYALDAGTLRRSLALTVGSILIALFSYFEASWIFFWLNLFFAIFSGYYALKALGAISHSPNMRD